jgi:16S rRNA pseudouridine516 synthase
MADGEATVRLDKILANLGYGSRADVKKWIAWGEAAIAGPDGSIRVLNDPGAKVKPSTVRFRREPLQRIEGICVLLHKPVGYVCSHDEDEGSRIYDLLPEQWSRRNPQIVSIGRLDKDSSGLIVVTDNHPLVHRLTSPKHHVEKTYVVTLDAAPNHETVERFASGTLLLEKDDKPCLPAKLTIFSPDLADDVAHADDANDATSNAADNSADNETIQDITNSKTTNAPSNRATIERTIGANADGTYTCQVVMTEGRFRQVRRMFGACGRTVLSLHRTDFGQWTIDDLPEGQWIDAPQPH